MKGAFITLEGVEGCGKTTQMTLLRDRLETEGRRVLLTREPGGTPIAEAIRDILLDPANTALSPVAELLLYEAARAQHVAERIRPAL
ncbi:MAG: dTMP kinase, partial [Candidatus Hydrogenedentes bacterium]|nr:dTMP kinase [Candidatus Hydrogenedentota bacterium]